MTETLHNVDEDKLFYDNLENLKELMKTSTTLKNWKIFLVIFLGVIAPEIPFAMLLLWGSYKVISALEYEEGRHYEEFEVERVDGDEEDAN